MLALTCTLIVNPVPVLMLEPVIGVYGNDPVSLAVPDAVTASILPILESIRLATVITRSLSPSTPPNKLPNTLISCPGRYWIPVLITVTA